MDEGDELARRIVMDEKTRRNVRQNIAEVEDRVEIAQFDRRPVDLCNAFLSFESEGKKTNLGEMSVGVSVEDDRVGDGEIRLDDGEEEETERC